MNYELYRNYIQTIFPQKASTASNELAVFSFLSSSLPLLIQPGRYYKHIFMLEMEKVTTSTLDRTYYKTQEEGGRIG